MTKMYIDHGHEWCINGLKLRYQWDILSIDWLLNDLRKSYQHKFVDSWG